MVLWLLRMNVNACQSENKQLHKSVQPKGNKKYARGRSFWDGFAWLLCTNVNSLFANLKQNVHKEYARWKCLA